MSKKTHEQPKRQTVELAIEREKAKMVSEFMRNVSHDFRTPLTAISTSAHLLARSDDPEKKAKYYQSIDKQVQHLNKVIDSLFTITRLDSGVDVILSPLDINALLHRCFQDWHNLNNDEKIRLILEFDTNLPEVWADDEEIRLAMQHLYRNAIQHMPHGGIITIRTYHHEAMVVIEIEDTGTGIHATHLPNIFERFYRADPARNTATGSVGLGLTIVQKIIELHGGRIQVESEVGTGTTFRLLLRAVG